MEIECPVCHEETELDHDDIPERACDDKEWECHKCGATMKIGWYATAEVRGDVQAV